MFLTNTCTLRLVDFLLEGLSLVHAHQPKELLFEKSYVEKEDVGLILWKEAFTQSLAVC